MPLFPPSNPLEYAHDGEYYGHQGKYSNFSSELVAAQFQIGGVYCYVYRLEGTFAQKKNVVGILNDTEGTQQKATNVESFLGIQDTVLGENRDRVYNFKEIPIIKGIFQLSQSEMELLRVGFKSNETLSVEMHQNTIVKELGRRLIQGDVIELPHLREVSLTGRIANKWYEVKDISWTHGGADPTYQKHIVGVILQPLRHQQEFLDLYNNVRDEYGKTLAEQTSNEEYLMNITKSIQKIATEQASTTGFDTTIMWIDPNDPNAKPEKWTDDGKPPDGIPVQQGDGFPAGALNGDYYLRTDLVPNRLYRKTNNKWGLREIDHKREWSNYNWTAQLREYMSDRSEADKSRPYDLVSIHDVITDRESRSDPSGEKG